MMIDRLLEATAERNWADVLNLLHDHWIRQSIECFAVKETNPWETQFDERKISGFKSQEF
jgi:hypothetical protein